MKRLLLLIAVTCGCRQGVDPKDIGPLCECFSDVAYEAVKAGSIDHDAPQECCRKCGKDGLPSGKVLSGDRQEIVNCPCPDSCECKQRKSLIPAKVMR